MYASQRPTLAVRSQPLRPRVRWTRAIPRRASASVRRPSRKPATAPTAVPGTSSTRSDRQAAATPTGTASTPRVPTRSDRIAGRLPTRPALLLLVGASNSRRRDRAPDQAADDDQRHQIRQGLEERPVLR